MCLPWQHWIALNVKKLYSTRNPSRRFTMLWWKLFIWSSRHFFCKLIFVFWVTSFSNFSLKKHKFFVLLAGALSSLIYYFYITPGPHQAHVSSIEKQVLWSLYWIWLGVLSSIGFGSGLHTFLLYLGPHIARVTLAAFDCKSLNFPSPPYPDE